MMFRFVLVSALLTLAAAGSARVRPLVPQLDGRIVGGSSTTIERRPYQISLQYRGSHICGGSVISANYVLTAAHCTDGMSASVLSIRAGTSYRGAGGVVVSVYSICQHRNYRPTTTDSDVSVLRLASYLPLGTTIRPISLQPVGSDVAVGVLATVSGWGKLSEGGSSPSILQEVAVPRVSDATCRGTYGSSAITSRMSCYGWTSGGRDSCQGDSGGPLVVGTEQVGVVSWGHGCAKPYYPGVYAKVAEASLQYHIRSCIV